MSYTKTPAPAPPPRATTPGKPVAAPGKAAPAPGKPAAAPAPAPSGGRTPAAPPPAQRTGKVVHDDRGNAVWDWLKQTSRIAIESTSRLLRKLETPDLKIEDTQDKELRLMPDPGKCSGGGYDPYNQATKPRKPGAK
jgi:hypothetical protein